MVDASSFWEHLLSQRSGFIANMQFKVSTVTGKIQNVAVIHAEETATVMTHKRNIPTASQSRYGEQNMNKGMVRIVHGSSVETEKANQNRIQMKWLPQHTGKNFVTINE